MGFTGSATNGQLCVFQFDLYMRIGEVIDDDGLHVLVPQSAEIDQLFVSFFFSVYASPEPSSVSARRAPRSSPAKPYARKSTASKSTTKKSKVADKAAGHESDGSSVEVLDRPTNSLVRRSRPPSAGPSSLKVEGGPGLRSAAHLQAFLSAAGADGGPSSVALSSGARGLVDGAPSSVALSDRDLGSLEVEELRVRNILSRSFGF